MQRNTFTIYRAIIAICLCFSFQSYGQTFQYDWSGVYSNGAPINYSYSCGSSSRPSTCTGTSYATIEVTKSDYDANGNIVMGGVYNGNFDADPGAGTSYLSATWTGTSRIQNVFISKLTPTGSFAWAKQFGSGTNNAYIQGVGADPSGNTIALIQYLGTMDADPGPGVVNFSTSVYGAAIVKLNSSGNLVWAKQLVQTGSPNSPLNLTTDDNGNIYITGSSNGTTDFDPGPGTTNINGPAYYFAKYNSSGDLQWVKVLYSTSSVALRTIKVDGFGNVVIAGEFYQSFDADPGAGTNTVSPTSPNTSNCFFAKYDNNGNLLWVKQLVSASGTYVNNPSIALDGENNILLTAYFNGGTVDLDPGANTTSVTPLYNDVLIAKYDNDGNFTWGKKISGNSDDYAPTVVTDGNNDVYISFYSYSSSIDDGSGLLTLTNKGSTDIVSIRYDNDGAVKSAMDLGSTDSDVPLATSARGNKFFFGGYKTNGSNLDFDPGPNTTTNTFSFGEYNGIFAQYTVSSDAQITGDPSNATVCEGQQSTFHVEATGSSLSYKWQVYDGTNWTDVSNDETYSGATTDNLTISSTVAILNNHQFRCIVTPQGGSELTSQAATLTVNTLPKVTGQPLDATICLGQNASFEIVATGTNATYQWQVNTGSGWNDLTNTAPYSNVNTNTLSITNPVASFSNYQYRCIVSGTCTPPDYSNSAKLTINTSPSISEQSGNVTTCNGGNAGFSVTAVGAGTYQWQISDGEGNFTNLANSSTYNGVTTNQLSITGATLAVNGKQYRCIVSGTCTPPATSTPVTLSVRTTPYANIQAVNGILCSGTSTTINFSGTPGVRVSYTVNGEAQTVDLDNSGNASVNTGNLTSNTSFVLQSAQYIDAPFCVAAINGSASVSVKSLPTVNITGSTTLCSGNGTSIQFNGTANTTVGYTINGIAHSIDIGSSGNATVNTGNLIATTSYALTSVQYTDAPGCTQSVTGDAVVTINPIPDVDDPTDIVACNSQLLNNINFNGTVNGTQFDWTNSNTNIGLSASGSGSISGFNVTNNTGSPITSTITVTPKYTNNGVTCTGTAQSFTITVNPAPSVALPVSQTVCNGASTAVTTFTGVATSYSWTNDATTIGLGAAGTGDVPSFNAINTGTTPVVAHITVIPHYDNGGANCTGASKTYTIIVNPTPVVNGISNRTHCNNEQATAINFSGPVSGTGFSWTSTTDVGFGTSGNGDIAAYVAKNSTNAPITAIVTVTPHTATCEGNAITFSITVNPTPTVNTVSNRIHCNTENGAAISFSGNVANTSYHWTSTTDVGFGLSGDGTIPQYTATNTGSTILVTTVTVTPTANGCTGSSGTFTVTVNPTPTVNAITNRTHCNSENAAAISFGGPVSGTTFKWTSSTDIGFGTSGDGNISAYVATNNTNAPVTSTITVTPYANGCTGTSRTFTITVNPTPNVRASIASQAVCSGVPITTISLTGDVSGTVYHWTRNNTSTVTGIASSGDGNIAGTLSHSQTTAQTVTFTITPEANGCFGTAITVTVTVNPLTYITTQPQDASQYALENTSFTVVATGTAPVTYKWQVNTGSVWNDISASSIYSGQNTATLSLTAVVYSMNNYQYRCIVTGVCSSVTSNAAKLTVVKRPTTLTYSGDANEQYSDVTDLRATLIDQRTSTAIAGKTISFTLGIQSANGQTNTSGVAASTITINQDPAPLYNVVTNFAGDDTYASSSDTDPFDIRQEDARVDYTGLEFNATPCATCLSVNVPLQATIQDISVPILPADPLYDATNGDIRKARVKFVNRDNNTDISSWIDVTTLLSASDVRTGTVQFSYPVTLASNEDSRQITIGIVVDNGYYTRDDESDNTVVTVYKPVGESINGGGNVRPTQSAGKYSSDLNRRMNFGLNVKYNKNGSQPKGSVNMIFRRTVGTTIHTYQIKSNAISTVGIGGTSVMRRGQFVSKANLTDITNPLSPVSLGGNLNFTVTITDQGEPGTKDSIGVTLYGSDGSLFYSSNWVTTKTKELGLSSGNIVINSATFGSAYRTAASSQAPVTDSSQQLSIKVLANPTNYEFRIIAFGKKDKPISLSLIDMRGERIYTVQTVSGKLVQFGNSYSNGTYVVEAIQDNKIVTTKVIKE